MVPKKNRKQRQKQKTTELLSEEGGRIVWSEKIMNAHQINW